MDICLFASFLEISCIQDVHNLSQFTSNDLLTSSKSLGGSWTQCGTLTHNIWYLSKFSFMRYHVDKTFTIWPMMTLHDLWPLPQNNRVLALSMYTYTSNMTFFQASLLEIPCLQSRLHKHAHTHMPCMITEVTVIVKTKNQETTKMNSLKNNSNEKYPRLANHSRSTDAMVEW